MGIDEIIEEKRQEVLDVFSRHGVRVVRVFGSAAHGEAQADSDLDFLVTTGPVTSSWFPAGLILDLEQILGRKVDVVTENSLHWYIRDRVLSEAVPL